MRSAPIMLLLVALVVFAGSAYHFMGRRLARGESHAPCSTYRSDRRGTRRLFLLYEDAGLEPVRLKRELLMLEEKGLLFILEPRKTHSSMMLPDSLGTFDIFMPQELDAIFSWVSEGNSLVLASGRTTQLHERLGIGVEPGPPGPVKDARRVQLSPLTRSLPKIATRRRSALVLEDPSWVELFVRSESDSARLVQAAVRTLGAGQVVVLSDPYILTNTGLMKPANLTLAALLAGLRGRGEGRKIYFDEYHHGLRDPRTVISYIRSRGLHFALLQVIAVFALFAWRGRSRLGAPRRLTGTAERGSAEYVRAFSLIYRRARLQGSVIRSAYRDFQEKVALWAGLRRNSEPGHIQKSLKSRNEKAAARFKVISSRRSAQGPFASDADVLSFMRMIARFEKEFIDVGRRTRAIT